MSHLTRLIRFARHWHARIGVLASLFFLLLAATGVALNHTDALQLDKQRVDVRWLMAWYGLEGEQPEQGYLFQRGYFVGGSRHWLMDGRELPVSAQAVTGAVEVGGMRYVATRGAIHIFQPDGVLVEKLTGAALPGPDILQLGVDGDALLARTSRGLFRTEDALDWHPIPDKPVTWSAMQRLPERVREQAAQAMAPSLPLERVVLDVHSGRIFGRYGPWVMDLAAIILMLLSLSGLWIYLRSIRKR